MMPSEYGPVAGYNELNLLRKLDKDMRRELHAVIYHPDNCIKCVVTTRQLHMPCKMVRISRKEHVGQEIIDYMDFHGWKSAPLVFIYRGDTKVDEWHDMDVEKITEWNAQE